MRIFEIYTKDIILRDFWNRLEEGLEINEGESGLKDYLSKADEIIFKKFGINPSDKVYFIAGSARLYLYPELREAFGLTGQIGDLDFITLAVISKLHCSRISFNSARFSTIKSGSVKRSLCGSL